MNEPPRDYIEHGLIEISEDDDIYSLKRALWTNQTLLIKLHDEAKKSSRTLQDIRFWMNWLAVVATVGMALYWWKS